MRVLVTGSKGMLGTDLAKRLNSEGFEVVAYGRDGLNICNLDAVLKAVDGHRPCVIVNCAAYTDVDGCETNRDEAYRVNSVGPKNLAIASGHYGIPLLHISTDYVFDGEAERPYTEDDTTNPLSVYGSSKLSGELNIKGLTNKYFIIRTQWLYGHTGKNFVKTMLSLADEKDRLTVVNDQFGSPTFTKDLSVAVCDIIKTNNYGTYHVTNSGICSWYEFAKSIMLMSGKGSEILPCTSDEFIRPATRPKFSALENLNLRLCGFTEMRHYEEALADVLRGE